MKKILAISILLILALVSIASAITASYPSGASGSSVTASIGNAVGAGDTTVVSVDAGSKYQLYRIDFKPQADVTGTINIKLGSTTIYSIVNATSASPWGMNLAPFYVEGADGDDLIVNVPSGGDVYYNIHGRTVQ